MAFPSVDATSTSTEGTDTTAHTITLPSSLAGDLLVVIFASESDNTISDWDGFTSIFAVNRGTTAHLSVAYMEATSASVPGTSIGITTGSTESSVHIAYKISGHIAPATQAPEASTGATSFSNAPNPDALTPTGGAADFLFIAACSSQATNDPFDGFPTSYDGSQLDEDSGGPSNTCTVGAAWRQLNAASDDPGSFDLAGADDRNWVACTIVVHPAAGGNAPTGNLRGPLWGPLAGPI